MRMELLDAETAFLHLFSPTPLFHHFIIEKNNPRATLINLILNEHISQNGKNVPGSEVC